MRIQDQETYSPLSRVPHCHPIPFHPLSYLLRGLTTAMPHVFYIANSFIHVYLPLNSIFMIGNYIALDACGTSTSSRRKKNAYQCKHSPDSGNRSRTREI